MAVVELEIVVVVATVTVTVAMAMAEEKRPAEKGVQEGYAEQRQDNEPKSFASALSPHLTPIGSRLQVGIGLREKALERRGFI